MKQKKYQKENIVRWLQILFLATVGVLFLLPIREYRDCYDVYLEECNFCHSKNKSYSLCSGFCFACDNQSGGCEFDLDKKCEDSIPHNYCVSESYRWRWGLLKLWGEEYYHGG